MATSIDQVERLKELQSLVLDVHSNLYRMRTIGKHRGFVYEYQHGDDGRMVKVYHDGRIEDGGEEPWQATSIAVSRLGGFPVSSITEAIRPACAPVEPIAWVRDLVERSQMLMHGYSVDGPDWEPRAAAIWHAGAVSLNFAIAQAVAVATSAGDAPDAIAAEDRLATKEPVFPPDDGWHFRPGEVWFRGVRYESPDKHQWIILKTLVSTDKPWTRAELWDAVDPKNEVNQSDNGMNQKLSALRDWLRTTFSVSSDPIPSVRGFGAYRFDIKIFG